MAALSAFPYLGGKSWNNNRKIGPWIAAHLPMRKGYCEPFAGMASVLLNRPCAQQEILNDANEHIVAWWRAVRDQPEELRYQLEYTPYSEAEYLRAYRAVRDNDHPNDLAKARDAAICLWQSFERSISGKHGGWAKPKKGTWGKPNPQGSNRGQNTLPDIDALADRLRDVRLFCRDALDVLEYLERYEYLTIYCDPAYEGETSKKYGHNVDREVLQAALLRQRNDVAISGYGDEWDTLLEHGWHKDTMEVKVTHNALNKGLERGRVEALWANYEFPGVRTGSLFA